MRCVWLTHSPTDDATGIVSAVASQLQLQSLNVVLDARAMSDPRKLWRSLKPVVNSPMRSDALLIYLSETVLADSGSIEAISGLAAGARELRGASYAVAGLHPGSLPDEPLVALGPINLISLAGPAWDCRVRAAVENRRGPDAATRERPFALSLHHRVTSDYERCALELRPLVGSWSPGFVALPLLEQDAVRPELRARAAQCWSDELPEAPAARRLIDGSWLAMVSAVTADRTTSLVLCCRRVPTVVRFGAWEGHLNYRVRLRPV